MNGFQKLLTTKGLTERQAEVTELCLAGKTNAGIAQELKIKPATVKFHLYKVFKVFNIKSRIGLSHELMIEYIEHKKSVQEIAAPQ